MDIMHDLIIANSGTAMKPMPMYRLPLIGNVVGVVLGISVGAVDGDIVRS